MELRASLWLSALPLDNGATLREHVDMGIWWMVREWWDSLRN